MRITLAFRDPEARAILGYLREKYGKPKASIEDLAKIAIRRAVAEQAQKELSEAESLVEKPERYWRNLETGRVISGDNPGHLWYEIDEA